MNSGLFVPRHTLTALLLAGLVVLLGMLGAAMRCPARAAESKLGSADASPDTSGQSFTLTDHLGMAWEHELVTFPLDETASAHLTGGDNHLIDPAGKNIPFQILTRDGKSFVAFHADLRPQSTGTWRLTTTAKRHGEPPLPDATLSVKQVDDTLELTNGKTGLRIHTSAASAAHGPIAGLLLPTGQWVGQGALTNVGAITSYQATITQDGPVVAEVTADYLFADGGTWKATFQLNDGEPVVIIHESMHDMPQEAQWTFNVPSADAPNHLLYRTGNDGRPAQTLQDALIAIKLDGKPPEDEVFEGKTKKNPYVWKLHPWHHWWQFNDAAAYQLMYLPADLELKAVYNEPERANDWFIDQADAVEKPVSVSIPSILIAAGKAGSWTVPGKNGKDHGFTLKPSGRWLALFPHRDELARQNLAAWQCARHSHRIQKQGCEPGECHAHQASGSPAG